MQRQQSMRAELNRQPEDWKSAAITEQRNGREKGGLCGEPPNNPLQRNKCWPYFSPGLSGAVCLNESNPGALSHSLSINIFISLLNYLKRFLCSIHFTEMEVEWAAPSLWNSQGRSLNKCRVHSVTGAHPSPGSHFSYPSSNTKVSFTYTSDILFGRKSCELLSPRWGAGGARWEADAHEVSFLANSAGPCRQVAFAVCKMRGCRLDRSSSPFVYQLLRGN